MENTVEGRHSNASWVLEAYMVWENAVIYKMQRIITHLFKIFLILSVLSLFSKLDNWWNFALWDYTRN